MIVLFCLERTAVARMAPATAPAAAAPAATMASDGEESEDDMAVVAWVRKGSEALIMRDRTTKRQGR